MAGIQQADADGEVGEAADEIIRAINRVDHPHARAAHGLLVGDGGAEIILLTDDAIIGETTAQVGDDESLGGAVGLGDGFIRRGGVGFGQAVDLAEMLQHNPPRAPGHLDRIL